MPSYRPAPRPAVFMDRDGCLTEEVGYVNHPSRLRLLPRTAEAIARLNRAGVPAVMVTNQAGIARGYFSEETLQATHARLHEALAAAGARLDGAYTCTHHPSEGQPPYRADCDCRKPRPGLLRRAETELGVDLRRSWMVGDRRNDLEVAWNAGARAALVRSGYGLGELTYHAPAWPRQPDLSADHLLEAVQKIVAASAGEGVRA